MSPTTFFSLLGLLLAGIALIALGRRGVRINRHPICRQCEFDLEGVYPGGITCPECGAGLKREGWVRIGARRRFPMLVILGVCLAAAPLVPLGIYVYAGATGTNLNKYKPLGLLFWEARRARGPAHQAIGAEIHSRMMDNKLDADQIKGAVELALWLQEDRSREWSDEWGSVVEWAKLDGKLTPKDDQRFRLNAAAFTMETRPRVRAGDPLPIVLKLKDARLSPSSMLLLTAGVKSIKVGEREVDLARRSARSNDASLFGLISGLASGYNRPDPTQQYLNLTGSNQRGRWSYDDYDFIVSWSPILPEDLPVGTHTIAFDVRIAVNEYGRNIGSSWPDLSKLKDEDLRLVTYTATIDVAPEDAAPIELFEPTDELTATLTDKLRPQTAYLNGPRSKPWLQLQFSIADLPVPVSFEVVARSSDGKEWKMGMLTSGRGIVSEFNSAGNYRNTRGLYAQAGKLPGGTCDLILRPSPRAARRTTDLTRIYNGELVFKGVEVRNFTSTWTRADQRVQNEEEEGTRKDAEKQRGEKPADDQPSAQTPAADQPAGDPKP